MIKKILQIIAIIILIVLPFLPITESLLPKGILVDNNTIGTYLSVCMIIIAMGVALILFLKPKNCIASWLLIAIGFLSMIPLHLGPPRMGSDLLTASASIEKLRYGILIFINLLLFVAGLKIIMPLKSTLSKIFLIVLIATTVLNLWDNYSSLMLDVDLKNWITDGKMADDFFLQFDFHITWRTLARISLYVSSIILSFVLLKKTKMKKWKFIILSIFSLIGIAFCMMCLQTKFENYYFPFMIPAVALAPSYWLGLAVVKSQEK